jgi:hypothetical protein
MKAGKRRVNSNFNDSAENQKYRNAEIRNQMLTTISSSYFLKTAVF